MKKSIINPTIKSRGRPKVDSDQVNVRFSRDTLKAIDRYADNEPDNPGRPEAIRRLVVQALDSSKQSKKSGRR